MIEHEEIKSFTFIGLREKKMRGRKDEMPHLTDLALALLSHLMVYTWRIQCCLNREPACRGIYRMVVWFCVCVTNHDRYSHPSSTCACCSHKTFGLGKPLLPYTSFTCNTNKDRAKRVEWAAHTRGTARAASISGLVPTVGSTESIRTFTSQGWQQVTNFWQGA